MLPQDLRARITLIALPSDDTWARDHGAITVLDGEGRPLLIDFVFNGWGLKFAAARDNLLSGRLHQAGLFGETALRTAGWALEGGALEVDGKGTLLTTSECLLSPNRNPALTREKYAYELRQWLGIRRILWLDHGYLAGDDTDSHIDTLARFTDPETIAYVKCDDPSDEHYGALQKMEEQLRTFRTPTGEPYRLVSLPWPAPCFHPEDGHRLPATYANFLILNGAVLLPVYGVPQDKAARAVLSDLFPGREVVPIDCRTLIEWHGSLHCISMQFPKAVPLSS
jgi:agmatine deiminase